MQTTGESNTKNGKKQQRIAVRLSKTNLKMLRQCFSIFGIKTDFQRETGISRLTVTRILENEGGLDYIVKAMVKYARERKANQDL